MIKAGDQLLILVSGAPAVEGTPTAGTLAAIIAYQVEAGDTLVSIAGRFGSTVEAIVRENGLEDADQIRGQELRIQVPAGATPEATGAGSQAHAGIDGHAEALNGGNLNGGNLNGGNLIVSQQRRQSRSLPSTVDGNIVE